MFDWQAVLHAIDYELGHPTPVKALVLGAIISGCLTQYAKKNSPQLDTMSDRRARFRIRLFAFFTAFVPVWALWPAGAFLDGLFAAIALGVAMPTVYVIVIRTAARFAPWIEQKVSANPVTTRGGPDNDGA